MFDLEYGDTVVDDEVRDQAQPKVVSLSRVQLEQLARLAYEAASADVKRWLTAETNLLAAKFLSRGATPLRRIVCSLMGMTVATTTREAMTKAEKVVAGYPTFMTNWMARDAERLAENWLCTVNKMTAFGRFNVPASEFEDMRKWAARA